MLTLQLTAALVILLIAFSIFWVRADAEKLMKGIPADDPLAKDISPTIWQVACIILWFPFFPIYLLMRGKYKAWHRQHQQDTVMAYVSWKNRR